MASTKREKMSFLDVWNVTKKDDVNLKKLLPADADRVYDATFSIGMKRKKSLPVMS